MAANFDETFADNKHNDYLTKFINALYNFLYIKTNYFNIFKFALRNYKIVR